MNPEHPKPKFVKEVLLRCLRLSYHQRVADGVPESFQGLVPDMPEPIIKYSLPSGGDVMSGERRKKKPNELVLPSALMMCLTERFVIVVF